MARNFIDHRRVILADVLEAVSLRHGKGERHLLRARRDSQLRAFQVRDQHGNRQALYLPPEPHQLGSVRHLREQPWRHEAPDLYLPDSGFGLGRIHAFFASKGMTRSML
jgi:hypothetical protein